MPYLIDFLSFITILKDNFLSEAAIPDEIALFYPEAGFSDEAEVLLRKALSLDPENQWRMNAQAYFLTDEDRNVK